MRLWIVGMLPMLALACGACGGRTTVPESRASGHLTSSAWPSAPQFVVARGGHATVYGTVDSSGAFTLKLPKGDSYALAVHTADREVPVAFPRATGTFDATFRVSSDGVAIDLGALRYLPAGPKPAFAFGGGGACADGSLCVDDGSTTCEDGQGTEGDQQGANDSQGSEVTSHQVDANAEMAVPEHDAPTDATGCDSQGSQDQSEQEGEH